MFQHRSVWRKHFTMRSEKKSSRPRMVRGGIVLLVVLTLVMLYINCCEQVEPRFHLMTSTTDFHGTPQRVENQTAKNLIKELVAAPSRRPSTIGSDKADSTSQASVLNETAQLSGPGVTTSRSERKTNPPRAHLKNDIKVIEGIKSETGTLNSTPATRNESEQHWLFNNTEVQNMRQHILKFYNPEKRLTLKKSSLRIGQRLKYGSAIRSKKSTSFKVTEDFLKLIPNESPLKDRHFNTCAVVGNSGILLNSTCGQEIDSMDFVIRCNLPQIEGYEKDVGSKANLTTMNPSVVSHDFGQWLNKTKDDYDRLLRRLKQVGDQTLYVPVLTSPFGEEYARVIIEILFKHKLQMKTAFPPAGINNLMKKIWTKAGFKIRQLRPSTGVHMYTLAATICDQIHLYGFYPFSKDKQGRALRYHYYGTEMAINNWAHNMPEEFRAFQQLHQRGAVVLHTEPCY
ncbi:CMP-N-acetylneuraminate-poly-alpha-2,8-sialyltransferase-like isoform X2 [Branchiostoma lanceolatum]|uniref:CMP-N-acetylneuraminate-poly-alpha-2, 8-sialyltransferase-like isoform X2 n=1 Tax=Branchiostoma lanceolatum TaxID=7740 RepID=UPI00345233B8